jgi:YesN/AraC family two-component response regulator
MSNDVSKKSIQDNPILKNTRTESHFIHFINRWDLLHDALSNDLYIWKVYVENIYRKICNNSYITYLKHTREKHEKQILKYKRKTNPGYTQAMVS